MLVRIFFIFFLLSVKAVSQSGYARLLTENWTFYCEDSLSVQGKAIVPGSIYTDLHRNQIIQDPFFGKEELNLGWIAEKNWIYSTSFQLTPSEIAATTLVLHFESVDTYAEVTLDKKVILNTNNCFRKWEIDIRPWVKAGKLHQLSIKLIANLHQARTLAASSKVTLPGGEAPWIRKIQHHFGWDWSPRLPAGGILGKVSLRIPQPLELNNPFVQTLGFRGDTASLELHFSLSQPIHQAQQVIWKVSGIKSPFIAIIPKGTQHVKLPFQLPNARKWWSHDQGKPDLYQLQLELPVQSTTLKQPLTFGIRTLELVQENDRWGKSFLLRLNGRPVFAKGANLVPLHVFLPEIKPHHYLQLVQKAKEAGFNLLRIWGGGTYGSDELYAICDREGIMVWQDFMFACALYPSDTAFLNNVQEEIKQQVLRLRAHPSLALWCGNNEIDEAWYNWGWQKQFNYTANDSTQLWNGYQSLFHKLIPQILREIDPIRPYHPSSPTTGWGRKESLQQGDLHYWGVWWGKEPLRRYRERTGRFVSEYGFQSMPSSATLLPYLPQSPWTGDSSAFKNHQKHPFGFEAIQKAMEEELPPAKQPNDFEEYVYRTQVVQARALAYATHAHLLAFPRCMGSLFWQFNDCWPVASWSVVDHQYKSKPAWHTLKQQLVPVRLLVDSFSATALDQGPATGNAEDLLSLYLLNTSSQTFKGVAQIDWMDFYGKKLQTNRIPAEATAGKKVWLGAFPRPVDSLIRKCYWRLQLISLTPSKSSFPEANYYFLPDKDLELPHVVIQIDTASKSSISLMSNNLCRSFLIEEENGEVLFFGDLAPNEKISISRPSNLSIKSLKWKMLNPNVK